MCVCMKWVKTFLLHLQKDKVLSWAESRHGIESEECKCDMLISGYDKDPGLALLLLQQREYESLLVTQTKMQHNIQVS